jgi:hypothetical protein
MTAHPMGVSQFSKPILENVYRDQRLNMSFEKVKTSLILIAVHVKTPVRNRIISDLL